jgi:NAD(P)-dependent dehydrogenase (short-subunit alcohol dehydrogenase family)
MMDAMQGKLVLITGATRGIGRVAAIELARLGADLVLVARDPARAEETRAAIAAQAPASKVEVILADLSSQAEVRRVAAEFKQRHARLDVLINNAGGTFATRRVTVDGLEHTFAVNHLAYFTLTNLLLDELKASAPSRVVSVASGAHAWGALDFDDLQTEKHHYIGMRVYCNTKLMNILFTRELARRLEGAGVTANCVHPGAVHTGFGRNDPGWFRLGVKIWTPFMISAEKGARVMVWAASAPEIAGTSGKYFFKNHEARSSRAARDDETAARLWEVSAKLTGIG